MRSTDCRTAPGGEEAGAGLDRARPAAGGLSNRAPGRGVAGSTLEAALRGTLPGMVRTGATFADAAAELLRYVIEDRGRKTSASYPAASVDADGSDPGEWTPRGRLRQRAPQSALSEQPPRYLAAGDSGSSSK